MTYLKSLFFNFLVVFFANHILPGIDVVQQTKLPHVGGDLIFAAALGLLNSLIYPILKVIDHQVGLGRICLAAVVISFAAYGVLKFAPIGIDITSIEGYLLASLVVAIGSVLTNYLELKHNAHKVPKPPNELPPYS